MIMQETIFKLSNLIYFNLKNLDITSLLGIYKEYDLIKQLYNKLDDSFKKKLSKL